MKTLVKPKEKRDTRKMVIKSLKTKRSLGNINKEFGNSVIKEKRKASKQSDIIQHPVELIENNQEDNFFTKAGKPKGKRGRKKRAMKFLNEGGVKKNSARSIKRKVMSISELNFVKPGKSLVQQSSKLEEVNLSVGKNLEIEESECNTETSRVQESKLKSTNVLDKAKDRKESYSAISDSSEQAIGIEDKLVGRLRVSKPVEYTFDTNEAISDLSDSCAEYALPIKNLKCKHCKKPFKTNFSLMSHLRYRHQFQSYKCVICRESFGSHAHFMNHMKRYHPETNPYPCDHAHCIKSFKSPKQLRAHMQLHYPFMCRFCKKGYAKQHKMREHVKKVHM